MWTCRISLIAKRYHYLTPKWESSKPFWLEDQFSSLVLQVSHRSLSFSTANTISPANHANSNKSDKCEAPHHDNNPEWYVYSCFSFLFFSPLLEGTGKSYVLRVLQDIMENLGLSDKIAFTAPTGVAACNVRGLTIHSWSGIGRGRGDYFETSERIFISQCAVSHCVVVMVRNSPECGDFLSFISV